MTNEQREQFEKALRISQQRRNELTHQRSVIEQELAQQSRAIAALAELLGETMESDIGLTGATLLIVRTASQPIAPTEVRDELKKIGYDMDGLSNPMASLHQILKRLEEKGEIEEAPVDSDGKKRYRACAPSVPYRTFSEINAAIIKQQMEAAKNFENTVKNLPVAVLKAMRGDDNPANLIRDKKK